MVGSDVSLHVADELLGAGRSRRRRGPPVDGISQIDVAVQRGECGNVEMVPIAASYPDRLQQPAVVAKRQPGREQRVEQVPRAPVILGVASVRPSATGRHRHVREQLRVERRIGGNREQLRDVNVGIGARRNCRPTRRCGRARAGSALRFRDSGCTTDRRFRSASVASLRSPSTRRSSASNGNVDDVIDAVAALIRAQRRNDRIVLRDCGVRL